VLITDLSLPVLDGFELVKLVRQDAALSEVSIICLSGYGGHRHDDVVAAGCDRLLQKPCAPDALAEVAAELVRARARQV
jgi:CheY-like chemotaxis protein